MLKLLYCDLHPNELEPSLFWASLHIPVDGIRQNTMERGFCGRLAREGSVTVQYSPNAKL